jgi:hypothetical protein
VAARRRGAVFRLAARAPRRRRGRGPQGRRHRNLHRHLEGDWDQGRGPGEERKRGCESEVFFVSFFQSGAALSRARVFSSSSLNPPLLFQTLFQTDPRSASTTTASSSASTPSSLRARSSAETTRRRSTGPCWLSGTPSARRGCGALRRTSWGGDRGRGRS